MNREIPVATRRAEDGYEYAASHIDHAWLQLRCGPRRASRGMVATGVPLSKLMAPRQEAAKRIVLAEGRRGHARASLPPSVSAGQWPSAFLLAKRGSRVESVARDSTLPCDRRPADHRSGRVRERYVEPMIELRKGKGLNAPMALQANWKTNWC